jgi:glycosyltransferase involved in cell wall biosynthesis
MGAGSDRLVTGAHRRPVVLFVVNVDWFFVSHRLPLARAARDAGAEVIVAGSETGASEIIRAEDVAFAPLPISRHGTHLRGEARTFGALHALYRRVRPDLVHHITIKPVLYGSLAARLTGVPAVVNAISGLGSFLTSDERRQALRSIIDGAYRVALRNPRSRTIFQNPDDRQLFLDKRFVRPEHCVLIRGAGVDCDVFTPAPEVPGVPVVMLPSRLLWDKGVGTFVEVARQLRREGVRARFVLVGPVEEENFMAVPRAELEAWRGEGIVEWWGRRSDMPDVLRRATIVVLPSRREGIPKVLLEAAACGRPMVATDVPGCREVVRPGETGVLTQFGDSAALAEGIRTLLCSPELRRRFGRAARRMAEAEFSEGAVVAQTMRVYREILRSTNPSPRTRGAEWSENAA